ncbi:MAG: cupredoxin domain-containing protein [Solirubrobacteraceae bacterium]
MRRRLPLLLALAALALCAGCGGDEETPSEPAGSGASGADVVEVKMKDILFVPENVTAEVGQTVRWTNEDAVAHNVKAESGADFASDSLGKGETFEFKLDTAGKIPYVCTLHAGQKGSITVQG